MLSVVFLPVFPCGQTTPKIGNHQRLGGSLHGAAPHTVQVRGSD